MNDSPGFKFDFAISYATPDFAVASELFENLVGFGFSVFLDQEYQHALIGKRLSTELTSIFGRGCRYFLPLISEHYAQRSGAQFEWAVAINENRTRSVGYVIPIRLDDTPLVGLPPDLVYIDARRTPIRAAVEMLARKFEDEVGTSPHATLPECWVATFGLSTLLIDPRSVPEPAALSYPALCDWLTDHLLQDLQQQAENLAIVEDARSGETLSVRVEFRWVPGGSQFPLSAPPPWELLEAMPSLEIYADAIRPS